MRLIVSYQVTDGCTYSADIVVPVVYESAEAFLVDFENAVKSAKEKYASFSLGGQEFDSYRFVEISFDRGSKKEEIYLPDVYTVDEWFATINLKV